jgi:hypothetical protein
MKRKTYDIAELKEYANKQLARTDKNASIDFKAGVITMIEHVLRCANCYAGFQFLNNEDSETGSLGWHTRKYF